ncbi:NAD(P)-dependent oxidoreductase [Parendozoicomonas sp. Alg238-R29]|uniref:NAD(P)-dependent oxidoreductase n=1 Tax=Parendozoicomonas sp. Alg238-R29 TaxID=2993446 RepID=UPI00248EF10B|nr:NAD(P)-dependent oxidoreductase [Parendozoicomonas sp. Alg238-R29]
MVKLDRLIEVLGKSYQPEDYPCIQSVDRYFVGNPAIADKRVLFAAPLFINTLPALLPWLKEGAEVTVSWPDEIAPDEQTVQLLERCGISCLPDIPEGGEFDVVLDCTAHHWNIPSHCGYVELTRSGATKYEQHKDIVCIDVDSSPVKEVETFLGTADGLFRAMDQLGIGSVEGKNCLVFGFGKVGRGISKGLLERGAQVFVAEMPECFEDISSLTFIDCEDQKAIASALEDSYLIVTATGVENLITENYDANLFIQSDAILVNMGAEDEYGEGVPEGRVLNKHMPVNFILNEPTRMKFLDPIMALYILCGVLLVDPKLSGTFTPGKHLPPEHLTTEILECFYKSNQLSQAVFEFE